MGPSAGNTGPRPPAGGPELEEEQAWQDELAALADMIGPVAHELHNVFNGIVLQAAILARKLPPELRGQSEVFRTLALQASQMLARLDTHRHELRPPRGPTDPAGVVGEVVRRCAAAGVAVEADVPPGLPAVLANTPDLRRLVWLLVRNAHAAQLAAGSPGAVRARARPGHGQVVLSIEDDGPGVDPERLGDFFNPLKPTRRGENGLELAACQALVRRLGGKVRAEERDGGGITVTVELDATPLPPVRLPHGPHGPGEGCRAAAAARRSAAVTGRASGRAAGPLRPAS